MIAGVDYEVRAVLAGAYRGADVGKRTLHTHALATDAERTACGRILAENLADGDRGGVPSCVGCARWERHASGRPKLYPCGCSILKVDMGMCDQYKPGESPR